MGERNRENVKERERERERGMREREKTDVPKLYAYNECEHSLHNEHQDLGKVRPK